jgi:hypothetical protein
MFFKFFLGILLSFCYMKEVHCNFLIIWKNITTIISLKAIANCTVLRQSCVYFYH